MRGKDYFYALKRGHIFVAKLKIKSQKNVVDNYYAECLADRYLTDNEALKVRRSR